MKEKLKRTKIKWFQFAMKIIKFRLLKANFRFLPIKRHAWVHVPPQCQIFIWVKPQNGKRWGGWGEISKRAHHINMRGISEGKLFFFFLNSLQYQDLIDFSWVHHGWNIIGVRWDQRAGIGNTDSVLRGHAWLIRGFVSFISVTNCSQFICSVVNNHFSQQFSSLFLSLDGSRRDWKLSFLSANVYSRQEFLFSLSIIFFLYLFVYLYAYLFIYLVI